MKMNRVLSAGILITAASALLWAGAVFLTAIQPVLIYFIGGGVVILIAGLLLEIRNSGIRKGENLSHHDQSGDS